MLYIANSIKNVLATAMIGIVIAGYFKTTQICIFYSLQTIMRLEFALLLTIVALHLSIVLWRIIKEKNILYQHIIYLFINYALFVYLKDVMVYSSDGMLTAKTVLWASNYTILSLIIVYFDLFRLMNLELLKEGIQEGIQGQIMD
jgi:hypothetical protein